MFHLYFGAFDLALYLGAAYFAIVLARAVCDELEQAQTTQPATTTTALPAAAIASAAIPQTMVSQPKKESVPVRVSLG